MWDVTLPQLMIGHKVQVMWTPLRLFLSQLPPICNSYWAIFPNVKSLKYKNPFLATLYLTWCSIGYVRHPKLDGLGVIEINLKPYSYYIKTFICEGK